MVRTQQDQYLLYFCSGQCAVRIICGNQVTVEQLNGIGVITMGVGCIIKDKAFICSHKTQNNTINAEADILKLKFLLSIFIIRILMSVNDHNTQKDSDQTF